MYVARMGLVCLIAALAMPSMVGAQAQWVDPYEQGLDCAKNKDWQGARKAFQAAIAARPDDTSDSSTFSLGPTRRETWRDGAPYTPNFAAAYAGYRAALDKKDVALFQAVAKELETLRGKDQQSPQLYFVLAEGYGGAGDGAKRADILAEYQAKKLTKQLTARVDTVVMLPADLAAAEKMGEEPPKDGVKPPDTNVNVPTGVVPYVANKYAILIGVSKYGPSIGDVPQAAADCQVLKDALSKFAGYNPEHITVLTEPKLEELQLGVQSFASKLPNDAVVFFFFAGAGRAKEAHDYLIPSGSNSRDAFEQFVRKTDLIAMFAGKVNRTVAVFEVSRELEADKVSYGREEIQIGSTAQINACWEGERCLAYTSVNGTAGVWADAAAWVLENKLRGPRVPAEDFCFAVLQRALDISSTASRGQVQTPMLPRYCRFPQDGTF